jgi:signal peptidase II
MVSKKFLLISIVVLIIDQLTKNFFGKIDTLFETRFLSFHLVKNTGAGFGILGGQTIWLALTSLIVAVGIIWYYPKLPKEKIPQYLSALLLGGVVGNMVDRFFRGYVIDFIDFSFWPAFNVADAAITVAVIGMVVWYIKNP